MFLTVEKLEKRIEQLKSLRYRTETAVAIDPLELAVATDESVGSGPPEEGWSPVVVGETWRPDGRTTWLRAAVTVPRAEEGRSVVGVFSFARTGRSFSSGVEALLSVDGAPYQGLDPNHEEVFFKPEHLGGSVELLLRVWGGRYGHVDADPIPVEFRITRAEVTQLEEAADDLYFTAKAVHGTVGVLPEGSWERQQLLSGLDRAFLLLDWRRPGDEEFYRSVVTARDSLSRDLAALPKSSNITVRCIGHSHIDVAWLWRLVDTREKSARTFATVLRLMERFPEYVFLQTQPQLYDYIETDYPEIYRDVRARVAEGRWEAGGAMWLESDCNVPSGESLTRQLLYGIRYFEQTLGSPCEYLWLPDVFGYSWALPQLLKKAGLSYFMTTKISWNVYNRFPHDTFIWRGIDGSEVTTHFITTPEPGNRADNAFTRFYTYNGKLLPETVGGIWDNYQDKEINDSLLLSYGYGDGGGGPTREMLEMRRRLETMPGMPTVTTGRVDEYFRDLGDRVASTDRYVHRWDGELYLELHRGTYTSQAHNKRMNRHMENLLRTAEMVATFARVVPYPGEAIYESWKIILRNQFHDILPGSSITEVYRDSRVEYEEARKLAQSALGDGTWALAAALVDAGEPNRRGAERRWVVFNTLSWMRDECVELPWEETFDGAVFRTADGRPVSVQRVPGRPGRETALLFVPGIPPHGYLLVSCEPDARAESETAGRRTAGDTPVENRAAESPFVVDESHLSTPFYEIEWDDAGALTRIYDKTRGREVLPDGAVGNRFDVHEDKPVAHEVWEIDIFYTEKVRHVDKLEDVTIVERGAHRAVVRFRWRYAGSTITQDLVAYADHPRIDFVTDVDWQERQQLLKVAFPVDVRATEATYEIQFGTVKRPTHWNTSWDYARFETCAQQWIDLSERGFGVSLMNDCKYGHDVRDNVMRITLIKSGILPDPYADLGHHEFTYSFFAHAGDWFEAGTVELAHRLNAPVVVAPLPAEDANGGTAETRAGRLSLPSSVSFVRCTSPSVIIDTVKKAEDSDAWIVRCYECAGARGPATLVFHDRIGSAEEVNLLERPFSSPAEAAAAQSSSGTADIEPARLLHGEHEVSTAFSPYEVKTFRVEVAIDG